MTRQVDFIWINRDQKSFEWFVSLLTKLEMDQADEEPEGGVEETWLELEEIHFYNVLLPVRSLPGDAHVHDISAQQE